MKDFTRCTLQAIEAIEKYIEDTHKDTGLDMEGCIACPVCQKGALSFSRAALNGHIWGKCSTEDCVNWMM